MKLIVLASFLLTSFSAYSATKPPKLPVIGEVSYRPEVQCPQTHSSISGMLKSLRKVEVSLAELGCKEVSPNILKLIEEINNEGAVLEDLKSISDSGEAQSADKASKLTQQVEAVVTEAGVLISTIVSIASGESELKSLLGLSTKCQLKDQSEIEALSALTGIVSEYTKVLSKTEGPYGVPLQLGFEVLSGVITGLEAFMTNSKNVDFSKGFGTEKAPTTGNGEKISDRLFRIGGSGSASSGNSKKGKVPDGGLSKRIFYEQAVCVMTDFDFKFNRLLNPRKHLNELKILKKKAEEAEAKRFEGCEECQYILFSGAGDNQIERELERLEESDDFVTRRLGDSVFEGHKNLEWFDGEIASFESVKESSKGIGPYEVNSLRKGIRNFLYKTAARDFLNYYISQARLQNNNFEASTKKITSSLKKILKENKSVSYKALKKKVDKATKAEYDKREYEYYKGAGMIRYNIEPYAWRYKELYELSSIIKSSSLVDVTSEFYATYVADAFDDWKNTSLAYGVVKEYCDFFKSIKQYSTSVKNVCDRSNSRYHLGKLRNAYQAFYLASLMSNHSKDLVKERGAYDFELEENYKIINEMKADKNYKITFPEIDIDFDGLIAEANKVEEGDLVLNGYSESVEVAPFEDWFEVSIEALEDVTPILVPAEEEVN